MRSLALQLVPPALNFTGLAMVVPWRSGEAYSIGVVNSIPSCVTFLKRPLMREATGNYLMNSISLEETQSPVSGFCDAKKKSRMQRSTFAQAGTMKTELALWMNGLKCAFDLPPRGLSHDSTVDCPLYHQRHCHS